MNNDQEQMQFEFRGHASSLFFTLYHGFETAVSNVSRRNDEFRFQQLKKQYAATMEQELQTIAKDVLAKHRNEQQVNQMDQMFGQFIKDYLHRFIQKVNDL
jgi:uncharacterized protein involved in exopolysaccharide biosynthesis